MKTAAVTACLVVAFLVAHSTANTHFSTGKHQFYARGGSGGYGGRDGADVVFNGQPGVGSWHVGGAGSAGSGGRGRDGAPGYIGPVPSGSAGGQGGSGGVGFFGRGGDGGAGQVFNGNIS